MISQDIETSVLESIQIAEKNAVSVTQRDLARSIGLSLGMTNALLRRLAERGWIKLTKLSTRTIRYALTPEGVAEIARRTSSYFRRAARNAELYRGNIETEIMMLRRSGIATIVLAGTSELDFLIEYLCERHGIVFIRAADAERAYSLGKRPGIAVIFTRDTAEQLGSLAHDVLKLTDIIRPELKVGMENRTKEEGSL